MGLPEHFYPNLVAKFRQTIEKLIQMQQQNVPSSQVEVVPDNEDEDKEEDLDDVFSRLYACQ